jgi:6-phosphogluconolactonase
MPSRLPITVVLCALASVATLTWQQPNASDLLVYIGTYTGPKSKGIYVSRLDATSGALSPAELAGETPSPSFLAIHPTRDFLYAVNEVGDYEGKKSGSVSAFGIDRATGKLTALNKQPSVGGGPAHISLDGKGQYALVANYGGGSIAALPIGSDGLLKPASSFVQHTGSGKNPDRQKEPHAHSIDLDSSNRFAYVADLGIDKVMIYRFDAATGTLTANDPPSAAVDPGSGPRHVALHPQGRYAYVINELTCTVTAFSRDPDKGSLTPIQTVSTLPAGQAVAAGYSTAEITVHLSGKFLYGSNRGHDTIVVFAIDQKTGQLTLVEHQSTQGSTPRNFGIDPSGAFLLAANQRSDSIVVFRINAETGRLTPTGTKIDVGAPVCVKFVKRR